MKVKDYRASANRATMELSSGLWVETQEIHVDNRVINYHLPRILISFRKLGGITEPKFLAEYPIASNGLVATVDVPGAELKITCSDPLGVNFVNEDEGKVSVKLYDYAESRWLGAIYLEWYGEQEEDQTETEEV